MPAAILSRANTVSVRAQSAPKAQKPAPAKPVLKAAPIAAAFAAISLMAASSPAFAAVDVSACTAWEGGGNSVRS
eukprot:1159781-Pelagomonas_calceolata.AAC.3